MAANPDSQGKRPAPYQPGAKLQISEQDLRARRILRAEGPTRTPLYLIHAEAQKTITNRLQVTLRAGKRYLMKYPDIFQLPSFSRAETTVSTASFLCVKIVWYWTTTYSPSGAPGSVFE